MNNSPKAHLLTLPVELLCIINTSLKSGQEVLNLARSCKALWRSLNVFAVYKKDVQYQLAHANDFISIRPIDWDFPADSEWYYGRLRGVHSVDPEESGKPREPILHWAINNDVDIRKIEQIVDYLKVIQPDLLDGSWHPGWPSPIAAAIPADRLDVVKLLLRKGCSIQGNQRPAAPMPSLHHNVTVSEDPLLVACNLGNEHIASFLVDNGATLREWHLAYAGGRRMIQTFTKIAALINFTPFQQRVNTRGWKSAPFYTAWHCQGKAAANKEIIDLCIAHVPELKLPRHMEFAIVYAFIDGYIENALYMFGLLVQEPAYSPLYSYQLVLRCPHSDSALGITKLFHRYYGSRAFTSGWSLTQHMLLVAIQGHWGDGRNAKTIEYLLSTGCEFTRRHLEAVERSQHPRVFPAALINIVEACLRSDIEGDGGPLDSTRPSSVPADLGLIVAKKHRNKVDLEADLEADFYMLRYD